jgi:deoxyribonuclease V
MKIQHLHSWEVTVAQAKEIQRKLATQISRRNEITATHLIAGVDISAQNTQGVATGAVVVLSYPGLTVVETKVVRLDFCPFGKHL